MIQALSAAAKAGAIHAGLDINGAIGVLASVTLALIAYLGIRAQSKAAQAKAEEAKVKAEQATKDVAVTRAEVEVDARHGLAARDKAQAISGKVDQNSTRLDSLALETGKYAEMAERNADLVSQTLTVIDSTSRQLDEAMKALATCHADRAAQVERESEMLARFEQVERLQKAMEGQLSKMIPDLVAPPEDPTR